MYQLHYHYYTKRERERKKEVTRLLKRKAFFFALEAAINYTLVFYNF